MGDKKIGEAQLPAPEGFGDRPFVLAWVEKSPEGGALSASGDAAGGLGPTDVVAAEDRVRPTRLADGTILADTSWDF